MKEKWKAIKGYEGKYEISNYGNVRSVCKGILLKPFFSHNGYLVVQLSRKEKERSKRNKKIHRLVAETFIQNTNNLPTVDHIDNIRTNNREDNLRWASHSTNTRNRAACRQSTSKYNGVNWDKQCKKWRVMVGVKKSNVYLGVFTEEVDAAVAFNKFCIENNLDRELNIIAEV